MNDKKAYEQPECAHSNIPAKSTKHGTNEENGQRLYSKYYNYPLIFLNYKINNHLRYTLSSRKRCSIAGNDSKTQTGIRGIHFSPC